MLPDESVVHDALVLLEDALELGDVVVLVGADQVRDGKDLGVVLVGLGLLRVERVDGRLHEHVGQHQVLEARGAPRAARLVVVLEGLEEVRVRLLVLLLAQVHLAAAL